MSTPSISCYNGLNKWFKFQATTSYLKLTVTRGSAGTSNLALFSGANTVQGNDDLTFVSCEASSSEIEYSSLVVGQYYYVSFGTTGGNRGTFGFKVETEKDFDFAEGAITLLHQQDWETSSEAYNNLGDLTINHPTISCYNGLNKWFKFQATSDYMKLTIKKGSAGASNIALFQGAPTIQGNNDLTFVDCAENINEFENTSLTVGNYYYISFGTAGNNRGSFGFKMETEKDFDFAEGAQLVLHQKGWETNTNQFNNLGDETINAPNITCYNGLNKWFKFKATEELFQITVLQGTIGASNFALYQGPENLQSTNELVNINCAESNLSYQYEGLQIGEYYYLSIGTIGSNRGTFGLRMESGAFTGY